MVQTQLPREMATSMERIHVQEVYDQIAPHFADLKQKAWPKVKQFIKSLEPGSLVADVGCGNGRYLRINSSVYKIGSDICHPLIQHANQQGHEVITADNLHLPYRDGIFDAVISIGVIHHFSSESHRVQALKELSRVLSPGGKLMVYVWAFEQRHRRFESQDVLIPWHKPVHPAHRLYRGSCSDVDHSSNSSVSDDDTSSLSSFSHILDSPPDDVTVFPRRIQSLEDFRQSSEEVFEKEDVMGLISSKNGSSIKQHTLVQECRRLEACLKELSEKQLSTNDVCDSKDSNSIITSSKYNCRKKPYAGVTASVLDSTGSAFPSKHEVSAPVGLCLETKAFLPTQSPPIDTKPCLKKLSHLSTYISHQQEHAILSGAKHSHVKPNIFQKLKMSFQGLIATHEEKKCVCDGASPQTWTLAASSVDECPELFAVREFPMSSLPTSEEPDPNKEMRPFNDFCDKMKRNTSDAFLFNLQKTSLNRTVKDEQKNDHMKLRSTSVKSLPLDLASVDPVSSCKLSRCRVKSIDDAGMDGSYKSISTERRDGHDQRKLKLNGLQKGHSKSQSDLLQGKTTRGSMKKRESASRDFAKASCQNIDDNDPDVAGINGHSRRTSRKATIDSASSDSFLSSISGTPTNTDLCRYYHVFKEGELCDIVKQNIEDLHITETYFDHANWCLIAEKVKF